MWWRVGRAGGPLRFPPKAACRWKGRFDDPRRSYRTLYCAANRITALYEVLAPFRLSAMFLDERATIPPSPSWVEPLPEEEADAGRVPLDWRQRKVLAPARIQLLRGSLINLDSVPVRQQIARRHPWLLREHELEFLDRDIIQGRNKELTRALGRLLYEEGAAGVLYPSKLNGVCAALFERRARLMPVGRPLPLAAPIPELAQVCRHLGLSFDP